MGSLCSCPLSQRSNAEGGVYHLSYVGAKDNPSDLVNLVLALTTSTAMYQALPPMYTPPANCSSFAKLIVPGDFRIDSYYLADALTSEYFYLTVHRNLYVHTLWLKHQPVMWMPPRFHTLSLLDIFRPFIERTSPNGFQPPRDGCVLFCFVFRSALTLRNLHKTTSRTPASRVFSHCVDKHCIPWIPISLSRVIFTGYIGHQGDRPKPSKEFI